MKPLPLVLCLALLAGCNTVDRVSNIGRAPELSPIQDPVRAPDYRPVSMPMPAAQPPDPMSPNSLWRTGARGFFRDQRARQVGDVLTVNVKIKDQASLRNETERGRTNNEGMGIDYLFNLDVALANALGSDFDASNSVGLNSSLRNQGRGTTRRTEDIDTNVAAVIVQTLPNGNLVIQGRQEVRVNFEIRELLIAGVVRPEDISPTNTISHEKIAELRVAYGGRGQLTDVQQPRYGSQVLDIILPF
ncbi:MAG: flagellar basal body L-ring protein FlgH [Geminicoccaceae bacterium]|nr:MAG: flagellar basal body L-ring protein FlgH [Geminicoccaceae bacterium]